MRTRTPATSMRVQATAVVADTTKAPDDGESSAGPDVSAHTDVPAHAEVSEGGDPVCWLDLLCPACGAMIDGRAACWRCAYTVPGRSGARSSHQ